MYAKAAIVAECDKLKYDSLEDLFMDFDYKLVKTISRNKVMENASAIEEKFVHEVYDQIAPHFDKTRIRQWKGVKEFLDSVSTNSLLLDVGCGNGKYLNGGKLIKIGCDRSFELCKIARDKNFNVFQADCRFLPFSDHKFDAVISIAVIHHLVTEDRRRMAISEILRVLKPGCVALIYVWAFEQCLNGRRTIYLKNPDKIEQQNDVNPIKTDSSVTENFIIHENGTEFKNRDNLVPWRVKQNKPGLDGTYLRFYHVFAENELENLCRTFENCQIVKSFYEEDKRIRHGITGIERSLEKKHELASRKIDQAFEDSSQLIKLVHFPQFNCPSRIKAVLPALG
uniref:Methyltransferase type 11 domain-containing protein n=1 Tax=Romanomermis culicivorax TaxID=13658 RepID=A0A915ID56_ROMCU